MFTSHPYTSTLKCYENSRLVVALPTIDSMVSYLKRGAPLIKTLLVTYQSSQYFYPGWIQLVRDSHLPAYVETEHLSLRLLCCLTLDYMTKNNWFGMDLFTWLVAPRRLHRKGNKHKIHSRSLRQPHSQFARKSANHVHNPDVPSSAEGIRLGWK